MYFTIPSLPIIGGVIFNVLVILTKYNIIIILTNRIYVHVENDSQLDLNIFKISLRDLV